MGLGKVLSWGGPIGCCSISEGVSQLCFGYGHLVFERSFGTESGDLRLRYQPGNHPNITLWDLDEIIQKKAEDA